MPRVIHFNHGVTAQGYYCHFHVVRFMRMGLALTKRQDTKAQKLPGGGRWRDFDGLAAVGCRMNQMSHSSEVCSSCSITDHLVSNIRPGKVPADAARNSSASVSY